MAITLNGTTGIDTPAITNNGTYTGDGVVFADATPANTLVTTTGGNVGIGTASPSKIVDVYKATLPQLRLANSASGTGANDGYAMELSSSDAYLWNYENGFLAFGTGGTERMRIASNNPTLFIATTTGNANDGGIALYKNTDHARIDLSNISGASKSTIVFYYGSATSVGAIVVNSASTTYSTTSDYRLKENVAPMTGALATVQALKPVTYTWKADGSDGQGFIAHELQAVVPDCVTGEKDAVDAEGKPVYQGIDTSFLVATLTCAIQELKAELDTVKSELATLKGTV